MTINGVDLEEWVRRCPGLFEETDQYVHNKFLRRLKVCHKKIDWEINYENISVANTGVTYNGGGD